MARVSKIASKMPKYLLTQATIIAVRWEPKLDWDINKNC
ncbi:hypothetical protein [Hoylesella shahii]